MFKVVMPFVALHVFFAHQQLSVKQWGDAVKGSFDVTFLWLDLVHKVHKQRRKETVFQM